MSTVTDPIADLLARVRNAANAQKPEMFGPYSKIKAEIVRILKDEGYIVDYSVDTEAAHPRIKITNKVANRTSAITGLKRVSRPGLRRYVGAQEIPRVLGGMGVSILSTPRGILSGREAKKQNVEGVGFKAAVQGSILNLSLGKSHPILFPIPKEIKITVADTTKIMIQGIDKKLVGQVAADIRRFYPPEPYKGKGVRYAGEIVRRKEGKTVQ